MRKKILMLSANPKSTERLRLDEEERDIDEGLRRSRHRDEFELTSKWAVRSRDLRRYMLDVQPQIVHFSGHGSGEEGIVLEDEVGKVQLMPTDQLAGLFKLFAAKGVECVLLNACYSEAQATAIAQYIPYVIGMSRAVGDKAAIEFAVAFYDALGAGGTVEFAYELGCNELIRLKVQEVPVLKKGPELSSVSSSTGLNVGSPVNSREQALNLLNTLLPSQFDLVVFKYNVHPTYLSNGTSQVQRAIEVIRYAEQKEGASLIQLLRVIHEVAPHIKG